MVPANTAAALRRMRSLESIRHLWIDAVCIDQTNIAERSQQVALMSSVYSSSKGNLIHLTDDEEAGRRFARVVTKFERIVREETDDYRRFRTIVYHDDGDGARRIRRIHLGKDDYADLEDMMHLPWFR